MKVKYLENSRPTKPWVRRYMLWVLGFFLIFLPRFIFALASSPVRIAVNEWEELRDEVKSYKCGKHTGESYE